MEKSSIDKFNERQSFLPVNEQIFPAETFRKSNAVVAFYLLRRQSMCLGPQIWECLAQPLYCFPIVQMPNDTVAMTIIPQPL